MARTLLESKINLIEPETINEEVDLMKVDFDELNKGATAELKKLLKNIRGVEFTDEKPDGFSFETSKGKFWFQCETDDVYEESLTEEDKKLCEEKYEDEEFQALETVFDEAGFNPERFSDAGVLTKNLGWILDVNGETIYLSCDGTWLDESKTLKEDDLPPANPEPEITVSTTPEPSEEVKTNAFVSMINHLVVGSFNMIDEINSVIATASLDDSVKPEVIEALNDLANEEAVVVGKLQGILSEVNPLLQANLEVGIDLGKESAKEKEAEVVEVSEE